ncbi:DNA-binding transcriptional activator GcvA [compost metagenome]
MALVPRYLVAQELAEGKLVVPWQHSMRSSGAHFLAFAEHAAEVPKVRALVDWVGAELAPQDHEITE